MENILLTGATGFLGGYIIKELEQYEYNIIGLGRNEKRMKERKSDKCKFYVADISDYDAVKKVFENEKIDKVIHCGALSSAWGPWEDFYRSNVESTRILTNLAIEYKIKRFIFISSPSIYSEKRNRENIKEAEYDENNELNFYIKSKILAEKVVEDAHNNGLYTITIRPRGIIGIGDPSIMPRIMKANEKMGIPLFNNGRNIVDITCVENVAYACYLALIKENIDGEIFNITNGEPNEFKKILLIFCTAACVKPRFVKIPFSFLYGIAKFLEKIYVMLNLKSEPAFTQYTLCTLAFSQTLNIDNAKNKLGYTTKISLDEGLKKYGEWWKENKENKIV